MKTKTKKQKQIENPCMICGKEVSWGKDGCPVVDKGSEMGVLFGSWKGMRHYYCKGENEFRLGDV